MNTIIQKIIDIENEAQRVFDEAKIKETELNDFLEQEGKKMHDFIMEKAKNRIELIEKNEQENTLAEINKINTKTKNQLEKMDKIFNEKSSEWESSIINNIFNN